MQNRWHSALTRRLPRAAAVSALAATLAAPACSSDDNGDLAPTSDAEPSEPADAAAAADASLPDGHEFEVEVVAEGLARPWGMTFLPDGDALVTERAGRLQRIDLDTGEMTPISGVPEVFHSNQAGLLDVALHPEFEANGWVYLTFAAAQGGNAATAVGRGQLDGDALNDFETLFVAEPYLSGGRHMGSRIVFDEDGYLFVTTGDRGERDEAQNTENTIGATLRLADDGSIPDDNPFVGDGDVADAIYSYGHRNAQGMAIEPATGRLWQVEHGPSGGDEINLIQGGGNHGWPIATYGVEYSGGAPIGDLPHERDDTVNPVYHWEPRDSFAPSGLAFYDGDIFPAWRGDLFVGSLVTRRLLRFTVDGDELARAEVLFDARNERVRDVRSGPDGYLYVIFDEDPAQLVRLVPADE